MESGIMGIIFFLIQFAFSDVCNFPDTKRIASRSRDVFTWDYPNIQNQISSFTDSSLPIIVLHTSITVTPSNTVYDPAFMTVFDNPPGMRNSLSDTPAYQGPINFRMRGQSTRIEFEKKQWRVELLNGARNDSADYALLGLPEDSDWIFNAPYSDISLLKNSLMYSTVRNVFNQTYVPRYRYFELFMVRGATGNTEPPVTFEHYEGLYLLLEKIKRGKNRVDISKLEATDLLEPKITGGYIFSLDKIKEGDNLIVPGSYASGGTAPQQIQIGYPNPEKIHSDQTSWLENYLLELNTKQINYDKNGYLKYIFVQSFVDYMWIQEIVKNGDAYGSSVYFYKDRSKKIQAGPTWDHNYGLGAVYSSSLYSGWKMQRDFRTSRYIAKWFVSFMNDDNFYCAWKQRWLDLIGPGNMRQYMLQFIDQQADLIREAADRNFQRWPTLSANVWPNIEPRGTLTWDDHLCWLKNFVNERLDWLNTNIQTKTNEFNINCANLCAVESADELLISEVMVTSERQWIEFYNPSNNAINLKGYYFTDKDTVNHRVYFSDNAIIQANTYLVIYLDDTSTIHDRIPASSLSDWKLGKNDMVQVFNKCWKRLNNAVFSWNWAQVEVPDVSLGRCDGVIKELYTPSPGEANICIQCSEQELPTLYINEVNMKDDWIEIYNPEDNSQDMSNFFLTDEDPGHRADFPDIEIQSKQYWVFELNKLMQFGFGQNKDSAKLVTRKCGSVIDFTSWDFTNTAMELSNHTWGRCPDASSAADTFKKVFKMLSVQNKNESNEISCRTSTDIDIVNDTTANNAFRVMFYFSLILSLVMMIFL